MKMNLPPDEYEKREWHIASQLAPPGVKLLVEQPNGDMEIAIRHSHIPTRNTDDFGYRHFPTGNDIEVVRWAHL